MIFAGITTPPVEPVPAEQPAEKAQPPEGVTGVEGGPGSVGVIVDPPRVDDHPAGDSAPTAEATAPKPPSGRRRAHRADGTFQADDPATPDVDEAFVEG